MTWENFYLVCFAVGFAFSLLSFLSGGLNTQGGTRHAAGARSEDGSAIAKGFEVVVTRYERGIAYVRRWEEMAGWDDAPPQPASSAREGSQ